MAFALYIYSIYMALAWLSMLFTDCICWLLDGTRCNQTEALMIRMCSFLLLYLATLPFLLAYTNKDNPSFLKRLAFHMEYGLAVILGSMLTMAPSGVEPKWWHLFDLVTFFTLFILLVAYTSNDLAPAGVCQSPWEGHGINPRSFLTILAVVIFLKVLTVTDLYPMSTFLEDPTTITVRAETFYSFAICLALAFLFILAIPIHYGSPKDQLNTTILILVVEFGFGFFMLRGILGVISPAWYTGMIAGVVILLALIVLALIGAYNENKHSNYDPITSNGEGESLTV